MKDDTLILHSYRCMTTLKTETGHAGSESDDEVREKGSGGAIAAVAAIGALLAGTFLFAGDRGGKNRTMVRDWMVRAKGEVIETLETMKDVSKETYDDVVDTVLKRYNAVKDVSADELADFRDELRSHWDAIAKSAKSKTKKVTRTE